MKNKILDLFQSQEMKKYIDENFDDLSSFQINSIICGAREPLENKLSILSELKATDEIYENSYNAINNALCQLELKENEIFILKGQGIDKEDLNDKEISPKTYECFPYNNYEKVIEYIKESCCQLFEYNTFEELCDWFVLEKWTLSETGIYEKIINYYISLKGDIWFYKFDYDYKKKYKKNPNKSQVLKKLDVCSDSEDLNIPTPFKVGDILTIDCRPFAELRKVLVVESGDNRDCCSLQGLYIDNQGEIHIGAVKHNSIFREYEYIPMISSLYKAEFSEDELSERDKPLQIISEYLNSDEEKGKHLWEYVSENDKFFHKKTTLKFDKLKKDFLDKGYKID